MENALACGALFASKVPQKLSSESGMTIWFKVQPLTASSSPYRPRHHLPLTGPGTCGAVSIVTKVVRQNFYYEVSFCETGVPRI